MNLSDFIFILFLILPLASLSLKNKFPLGKRYWVYIVLFQTLVGWGLIVLSVYLDNRAIRLERELFEKSLTPVPDELVKAWDGQGVLYMTVLWFGGLFSLIYFLVWLPFYGVFLQMQKRFLSRR